MAAPTVELRRATSADITQMSRVLAQAFRTDPWFSRLAAAGASAELGLRSMWVGVLRHVSNQLSHTFTTSDGAGVAVWTPPGQAGMSGFAAARIAAHLARLTGWHGLHVMVSELARLEKRRTQHVPEPNWSLLAVGVEPGRQGQGIGSALIRPVLETCDRGRVPAYLETAEARNLPLFERHGFRVVEKVHLPRSDVRVWLMRRDPSAAAYGLRSRGRAAPPRPTGWRSAGPAG